MFRFVRRIVFPCPKSHFQSSITSLSSSSSLKVTPISSPESIADYLINSLGFHEDEAIAVSSQVRRLKSTESSDLVVKVFKDYGLDDTQVRNIVSIVPRILTIKPNKTLEPKLRVFRELGLSAPDLVTLVRRNRFIFWKGLHTQIIPTVDYLRTLLGCDEKVVELINRSKWMLLANTTITRISENIRLLKKYGLSDEKILSFLIRDPQRMKLAPELFESKLQYVENKLGISRSLPIFIHGLYAVMYSSELEIENNIQVFRSFGWSDYEIFTLIRSQPYFLDRSEAYIRDKLKFFMKDLNYTPSYLMRCTFFWTLSLEKRLKPRNEVFKILKERELVKDTPSFVTTVKYSEPKFLDFLKRFESHIPSLCETYKNSIKNLKGE